MKHLLFRVCFCMLFLALSAQACLKNNQVDSDFMGNESCSPPCWHGITPGATSKSQALEILGNAEEAEEGTLKVLPTGKHAFWHNRDGKNYTLFFEDDIVTTVAIDDIKDTTLGALVDILGEPDGLTPKFNEGASVYILYPKQGLLLIVAPKINANDDDTALIIHMDHSLLVGSALFIAPGDRLHALAVIYGEPITNTDLKSYPEWKGFTEYELTDTQ